MNMLKNKTEYTENVDDHVMLKIINFISTDELNISSEISRRFYDLTKFEKKRRCVLGKKRYLQPCYYKIVESKNMINWALKHDMSPDHDKLAIFSIRRGNLSVVKYLFRKGCDFNNRYVYHEACQNNHFAIVKWLHRNGFENNSMAVSAACESGSLRLVKWLLIRDFPIDENSCSSAIYSGNIKILKLLIEKHGCEITKNLYSYACEYGNLTALIYLLDLASNDLSIPICDPNIADIAAENGHVHILEYLRTKHFIVMDYNTVVCAKISQNREVYLWCIENIIQYGYADMMMDDDL